MQLKLTWRVEGRSDMDLLVSDDQTNVLLTYSEADIYSGDILVLNSSADK